MNALSSTASTDYVDHAAPRLPWVLVVFIPILIALAGWKLCPPMLNPDSAVGFFVWEARDAGGPWNCYRDVDPANIAHDLNVFVTWWSPGQYEIPGLWRACGFSWGHVILLSTLAGCWIEALGCWFLARDFGAGTGTAAWFAAVSTLQWHTLFPFGHFRGGDVLLGAATPWMLLWAWRVRVRPGWYLAGIPLLIAGGVYLKLSAVLLVGPLLLAAGLGNSWVLRRRPLALAAWAAAAAGLAIGTWLVVQWCFLSRGANPGAGGDGRGIFSPVVFAVLSPWLAATGAGSFLGHIWWWLGRDVDEIWWFHGWFVLPVALAAWWWPGRWLLHPLRMQQRIALLLVLGGSIGMFALLFVRGFSIGVDDRYMRPTAAVLLLALALRLDDAVTLRRRFAALAIATIALFGAGSAAQRCVSLARMNSRGREDITQQQLSAPTLSKFADLDAQGAPRSSVIYAPIPHVGMEIRRQRPLLTDDFTNTREHRWRGRVPVLVVAVPDAMEADGRAARARSQFADYRAEEWHGEHVAGWWFWTVRDPAPSARS